METHEEIRRRIRELVSGRGASSRWITQHLEYAIEDWCLIYPFAWEEDHYPKYKRALGEHQYPVHRLMCEYRHGAPPTPEHHSAHSCDRGTKGCVNPMHVSWKTPSENQRDRFKGEGKFKMSRKLTSGEVEQIRALAASELPKDIAKRFGITVRNVRFIVSGRTWQPTERFSADQIHDIRDRASSVGVPSLAKEYGVGRDTIYRILNGETYKWVDMRQPATSLLFGRHCWSC